MQILSVLLIDTQMAPSIGVVLQAGRQLGFGLDPQTQGQLVPLEFPIVVDVTVVQEDGT